MDDDVDAELILRAGPPETTRTSPYHVAEHHPQLRTKCGERAFSHAGPAAWNALPEDMCAVSDSVLFRKRLKTHLFSLAFNVC